uniref:Transposable element P transposase-like RNase H domain-containing protein n=1 Tax=Amphimedon queenslandica TaxID=400682 RepID=A0A1X7VYD0_AMPQE
MIQWCLYIRQQSSKAYEALQQSGCIHLPSERTLKHCSHCMKAELGISVDVDLQLARAANLSSSADTDKLVFILLDEIHLKENLVFNKHSGEMVGFVDLGSINNHLLDCEDSLQSEASSPNLANAMMSFMIRGIFSDLRFPYTHFLCSSINGEQLFQIFWKAVYRLERMIFKVLNESVSKALTLTGGAEVEETTKFNLMFDQFFDMLNVTNFTKGTHSQIFPTPIPSQR